MTGYTLLMVAHRCLKNLCAIMVNNSIRFILRVGSLHQKIANRQRHDNRGDSNKAQAIYIL
jgi:hypothetical protein